MPEPKLKTRVNEATEAEREPLLRIIPSLILAPSAHNTQPWKFRVNGHQLDVIVDWGRHLPVSDPARRELYVSVGCALANAAIAAQHFGYLPDIAYFPQGRERHQPVSRLTLRDQHRHGQAEEQHISRLFAAIESRRTDRSLYDGQPLTAAEKQQVPSLEHNDVVLIENRGTISRLAELTRLATARTLARKDFKTELSRWVRNNWTRQPDGMPGYAMGLPAPISLVGSVMVRLAPIHRQEAPRTQQQLNSASAVAVITAQADTPVDWLTVGRRLQLLWLEATAAGLAAMPQVAAIEAGADIRRQVSSLLGTTALPQTILRLGRSQAGYLRATPRRSLEECLR